MAYSKKLCQIICCVFGTSNQLLLNVRSFLSAQMVHCVKSLYKSQILKTLLSREGIFFPKNSCVANPKNMRPYLPQVCFHGVNDSDSEVPCSSSNLTIPKSMGNAFQCIRITHVTHLTLTSSINLACHCTQEARENACTPPPLGEGVCFSFVVCILALARLAFCLKKERKKECMHTIYLLQFSF